MTIPPAVGRTAIVIVACSAIVAGACRSVPIAARGEAVAEGQWWKGNTHTHTLWSDGDHFPEAVGQWYRDNGYHFLAITDHNTLAGEERWHRVPERGVGAEAYRRYRDAFGADWVEERRRGDTLLVRLRRFDEYRARLEEPGRFLILPGEEITQYLRGKAAHMNGVNVAEPIAPQTGSTLVELLRKDLDRLREVEQQTGRNNIGVLNHPNFLWSQTAEDLVALPALRFFELYNGHPLVNNGGDSLHASTERMWDIVLTRRIASGGGPLYGVATDDSHDYHQMGTNQRNPGRGWIVVRSPSLVADRIVGALERGDFYASTGVELTDVRRAGRQLTVSIRGAPGVHYRIEFIGTRAGYDTSSVAVHDSTGAPLTRRYSADIGRVLAATDGLVGTYVLRRGDLYVRARVTSSRPKRNPSFAGELEMAWTQPLVAEGVLGIP